MKRYANLFLLMTVILLTACQSPSPTPDQRDFFQRIADLPHKAIALDRDAPPPFVPGTLRDVFDAHVQKNDFWLFASDETIATANNGETVLPWLQSANALRFETEKGPVWFVPARGHDETVEFIINGRPQQKTLKGIDLLAFVLENHLEAWVEPTQLARLWRLRGDALRREQQFKDALLPYEKAIHLNPQDSEAYLGQGAALLGLGQVEDALQPLLQAVALAPDNYWAQQLLGNAYLKLQRYELATEPLTRAYMIDNSKPQILIGVALSLGRSGHKQKALQVLAQAQTKITNPKWLTDIKALQQEFGGGN
jgi:tetratricopeptide (TPR) repeat protein